MATPLAVPVSIFASVVCLVYMVKLSVVCVTVGFFMPGTIMVTSSDAPTASVKVITISFPEATTVAV